MYGPCVYKHTLDKTLLCFISSVVFLSYKAAICGHQFLYPHPSSVSQIPSISPAITGVTAARWAALCVLIQGLDAPHQHRHGELLPSQLLLLTDHCLPISCASIADPSSAAQGRQQESEFLQALRGVVLLLCGLAL